MATSVGKETTSYCTSCRMDLTHTIVSMVGDRIAKVACRTCKKIHAYRAPKGLSQPTRKRVSTGTTAKKAAAVPIEEEWQSRMAAHSGPAKSYSTQTGFEVGEKLRHPVFGEGIVEKLVFPNKMEVIFRNDLKTLIHAGSPDA